MSAPVVPRMVQLTWDETRLAATHGVQRCIDALERNRRDDTGKDRLAQGWQDDIIGALGEWAVAKAFGHYWRGAAVDYHAGDVERLEVRTTHVPSGSLVLHPWDDDRRAYLLVIATPPTFYLPGWIPGKFGKQDRYWRALVPGRPKVFAVPQSALRPLAELIEDRAR